MGEHIVIDTEYSFDEVVRVKEDQHYRGAIFKIREIRAKWNGDSGKIKIYIEYGGMVKKNTSWHFFESQLEKSDISLDGFTWNIREGDVISLNDREWTVTDVENKADTGQSYMGGPMECYRAWTVLHLQAEDGEKMKYTVDDHKPIKKIGQKQKTFI